MLNDLHSSYVKYDGYVKPFYIDTALSNDPPFQKPSTPECGLQHIARTKETYHPLQISCQPIHLYTSSNVPLWPFHCPSNPHLRIRHPRGQVQTTSLSHKAPRIPLHSCTKPDSQPLSNPSSQTTHASLPRPSPPTYPPHTNPIPIHNHHVPLAASSQPQRNPNFIHTSGAVSSLC